MRCLCLLLLLLFSVTITQAQQESNYFVEAEISDSSPFVGQQVTYTFRVYSKVSRTQQGDIVDPDFEGFWQKDMNQVRRYTAFVDGDSYDVTERRVALFPTSAGTIMIEPAALLIPRNPSNPDELLLTEALTINVRELPDAPDAGSFDGAVGQFELSPTVDRQEIQLGEPVTLRLTVTGTGNLEQLPSPVLADTETWRVFNRPSEYQVATSENDLIGQKTFEWLLTALEPGLHSLPEMVFSYFEPSAQTYHTISTAEITVNVLPAADGVVSPVELPVVEPLALQTLPATLAYATNGISVLVVVLWIVPPAVAFVSWWQMRRRWQRQQNAAFYQRSEALKHALASLAAAQRSQDPYRNIREALLTYFGDKMNSAPSTLSYLDIEVVMQQQGIEQETSNRVFSYLEQIDQAFYAPGNADQNPQMVQQITDLMEALDRSWETP